MGTTVRQAVSGDEVALARLTDMVQTLHVGARPDVFVPVSESDLAAWFSTFLQNGRQRAWLAETTSRPVGYVLAVIHDRPATPFSAARRWCEIDQLGVAEVIRKRGVARSLVDAAISWARELGISQISAQCWSFNTPAQAAFTRLGFAPMTVRLERRLNDTHHPASA